MSDNVVLRSTAQPFFRRLGFREAFDGWTMALPAILGLLIFTVGPIIASAFLSLTNYNIVKPPQWIGLDNYVQMFTNDPLFYTSLRQTAYYSFLAIPLSLVFAYLIALMMNQNVRGITVYRTLWYLPALVPAVANATLWRWVLNRDFGLMNYPLQIIASVSPGWLIEPLLTVPSLVLIHLWGLGNSVLIFLAALQGVPQHLIEAAEIDGANWWHKFRHVTIPMTSSIIFFNLIMGIIGTFQVFTLVYVMFTPTGGTGSVGPENAGLMYVVLIYRHAFQYFRMGYASALAWVLFAIIVLLTLVMFRLSGRWVFYEASRGR
ncbi:MAG TPA: sugar ABC transporter permease [Chloroflexota bacterium]